MSIKKQSADRLPPFCPSCDREGKVWQVAVREVEQRFRSEDFTVRSEVSECRHCGFRLLTDAQTDELARRTADAYRVAHGLLPGAAIAARRKAMHLSQREFAVWVGVGPASIKRWEHVLVQDLASDRLLRERTKQVEWFEEETYVLPSPQMHDLIFQCAVGFTAWAGGSWSEGSEEVCTLVTANVRTSDRESTVYQSSSICHAFALTA